MDTKSTRAIARVYFRSCLLIFVSVLFSAKVAASSEPAWRFRVLTSEHFEVIYREEQKALAKRYIVAAEQAHELLMPIFKEGPAKTTIFISDDTDNSNGLATFLPYPMITVYPVLPSTLDSIDDYGDWPLEMIVHEYTHILNMYPAHGFYVPLKYIFGGVVRPNAVLPKWYLEGLAVNLESHLTDHGRLRADETAASARALVLSGRLRGETISDINDQDLVSWPNGSRPYLFGGWWWNSIHGEKGAAVIETWNQNFSRRLPFFLNGPMREQTGKSAAELLVSSIDKLEAQAKSEIKDISASTPHVSTPVTDERGEQSVFAISPSGEKLIYWASRPSLGSQVMLKARSFPKEAFKDIPSKRLFKAVGTLRARWMDENRVVFDQLDIKRPRVTYRDLYLYDFNSKTVQQLTHGLRAEEPAPSPKGDKIAFIQNDGGRNRLAIWNFNSPQDQVRILLNGNLQQRLSGPEFLNDDEILFTLHIRAGQERIYVYNLNDKKAVLWNTTLHSVQNIRKTAKGLLVSDAGTHVRNIYVARAGSDEAEAVSNTLTHIETSDYDPGRDELVYSELTGDGRRLMTTPFAKFKPEDIVTAKMPPAEKAKTEKVKVSDESYQPIEYLRPRYWIPFAYTVENGGLLFQGSTANSDPAGRNLYTINAAFDTVTKKPSYGVAYVNSSLPTDIGLSYAKSVSFLGASALTLESQAAGLNFSNYWPFDNRLTKWNVGGIWNETQSPVRTYRRIGPDVGIQYSRLQHPLNTWNGYMAEMNHTEFVAQNGYLPYGRTYFHAADVAQLGGDFRTMLQVRGAFAPRMPAGSTEIDIGDRNIGANYMVNLANSDFLLRGYPSGEFVGRKILNSNLELIYHLPEHRSDWGTFPLSFNAMEVAVFADAMSVDGGGYRPADNGYFKTDLSQFFMGTGAELRLNASAAYHLPVTFTLGAYYGLNQRYGGGFTPFLGLGLGDLGGIENKTP